MTAPNPISDAEWDEIRARVIEAEHNADVAQLGLLEGATKVQPSPINDETASGGETVKSNTGNDL